MASSPPTSASPFAEPRLADSFAGETWCSIPLAVQQEVRKNKLFAALYAVIIGWFPQARFHYRERPQGAGQQIMLFCLDGAGWFEIGGRRESLRANEVLFLPKHVPHAYGADEDDPWSIHWMHFDGHDALHFLAHLPAGAHKIQLTPEIADEADQLFRRCRQMLTSGFSRSNLLHLSSSLRYMISLMIHANPAYAQAIPARQNWPLREVIEYMVCHLKGGVTLDHLASIAGLSKSRFSANFKVQTGFSPMEYYAYLRIQEACHQLNDRALSIKQVSAQLGFEDQYYFSRVFTKFMGMAPSSYRAMVTE